MPAPPQNVQALEEAMAPFTNFDVVAALDDPQAVETLRESLGRLAIPDLVTVMVGSERGLTGTYEGVEGFLDAWRDWLSAFDRFQNDIEELIETGPDTVLALSRQRARTSTGGIELDNEAAAVFNFDHGRLARVEFHLDREAAARAAGVDPGELPG